jgi:hypothetical protein
VVKRACSHHRHHHHHVGLACESAPILGLSCLGDDLVRVGSVAFSRALALMFGWGNLFSGSSSGHYSSLSPPHLPPGHHQSRPPWLGLDWRLRPPHCPLLPPHYLPQAFDETRCASGHTKSIGHRPCTCTRSLSTSCLPVRHGSLRLPSLCKGECAGVGGKIRVIKLDRDVSVSNIPLVAMRRSGYKGAFPKSTTKSAHT